MEMNKKQYAGHPLIGRTCDRFDSHCFWSGLFLESGPGMLSIKPAIEIQL
jgi:hypothetical protein